MKINGTINGNSYSQWQSRIVSQMSVSSPMEIDITGLYDSDSRTGEAYIRIIATDSIGYSNLKLRLALTESNIYWHAPNGTNWHHQTFRDMIPNTSGIYFAISEGDTLEFTQSFSCPSPLVESNCELVVFVQSDSGRRILQGAKSNILELPPPPYELDPFSLISPPDDTTLSECYPTFVWHPSDDPDSGYTIDYQVYFSPDSTFATPFISDPMEDTSWACPVCLQYDIIYYWKVLASNGHAPDRFSNEVFSFYIDPGDVLVAPQSIELEMMVDDISQLDVSISNNSYYIISYTFSDSGDIISFDNTEGVLDTFAVDTVTVFFSSSGLAPYIYYDTIFVQTSHPTDTFLEIPVMLTVFDGYSYLTGDANMYNGIWPPQVIGSDVTYLVSYFRGAQGVEPCNLDGLWCSADVNGDCSVIGSDVTRLVSYFRGNVSLLCCPDYEPLWLSPDDIPDSAPDGWPGCETPVLSGELVIPKTTD